MKISKEQQPEWITMDRNLRIIGVVGTRRRNGPVAFKKTAAAVRKLYRDGDLLLSGGCRKGADRFAYLIAEALGCTFVIAFPNYHKHGRIAPFVRNGQIANHATHLVACVARDRTGGTEDTIRKFLKRKPSTCLTLVR